METKHNAKITSAELSQLWASYQNDSLSVCKMKYFLAHVEDPDIRSVAKYTLEISQNHIDQLTDYFKSEQYPVPMGFTENDVNTDAPRLFSDTYFLLTIQEIGKLGMNAHSVSISLSARPDLHDYFERCFSEYCNLHKMANDLLLSKGLYIRSPYLQTPKKVDFVTKQSFLTGWFGDRRPLVSLEITNLYDNIQRNALGAPTAMAFSQVAQSKTVGQYMLRGKKIAAKHVEVFGSILRENDLPVSVTWDSEITDSQVSPFSDKLMMFQMTALTAISIGYYGTSMATTMRRDISAQYIRLTAEIGKYAEDGANIMIDNGWMENPPQALDRDKLANK